MIPTTLTPQAYQELKRHIRQEVRQEFSNRRSLSRMGGRRREAVWMPSGSSPTCTYFMDDVEGFSGSGSSAELKTGNAVGWLGASSVYGDESEVGLSFNASESTPSTNGNWDVVTTGLYWVQFSAVLHVTASAAAEPTIIVRPYHKPSGVAIRWYETSAGANPFDYMQSIDFNSSWSGGGNDFIQKVDDYGLMFLEAGDRITWRCQLLNTTSVTLQFFDSTLPKFTVTRIGTEDLTSTNL